MIILICLLIIFFCLYDSASEADEKARRYNENLREERRHRELLEATRRRSNNRKYTRRRVVKRGDVTLGEEITEEDV
jgi:hypothetical protein